MKDSRLSAWTDEERVQHVKHFFNVIIPHYDLMNRILSARRDVAWRRFTAQHLPDNVKTVLDVATGTGDLAIEILRNNHSAMVVGVDFVPGMLKVAKAKLDNSRFSNRYQSTIANALKLPFPDMAFDSVTIAFALRNIPAVEAALIEMGRVLKPGCKLLILEMTLPERKLPRWFFYWYTRHIIPLLGSFIARNEEAYKYLPDSIAVFAHPAELSVMLKKCGFININHHQLSFGIANLHIACRY